MLRLSYLILASFLMLTPALAHTGIGDTTGLAHGMSHPVGGADHVLAMVAVGLLAALTGGRAVWLVPTSFVAMMALGGALAMAGIGIPFVEIGIGLSVAAALRTDESVRGGASSSAFAGCSRSPRAASRVFAISASRA